MKQENAWIRLEETNSTNDYAKALRGDGKNLLVTAKRQTGGRGTKGRSFSSKEGGIYLSKLSFYSDFSAREAFKIMIGAAVAVCETLRFYRLQPKIKWPNDVFVNGKKICGILIENTLSGEKISSSIVGIGLNVCNELPEELFTIATTMKEAGVTVSVEEVLLRLSENLERDWTVEDYRGYLGHVGERVTLLFGDERVPATLLSVTEDGRLQAEMEGKIALISQGEVSIQI